MFRVVFRHLHVTYMSALGEGVGYGETYTPREGFNEISRKLGVFDGKVLNWLILEKKNH